MHAPVCAAAPHIPTPDATVVCSPTRHAGPALLPVCFPQSRRVATLRQPWRPSAAQRWSRPRETHWRQSEGRLGWRHCSSNSSSSDRHFKPSNLTSLHRSRRPSTLAATPVALPRLLSQAPMWPLVAGFQPRPNRRAVDPHTCPASRLARWCRLRGCPRDPGLANCRSSLSSLLLIVQAAAASLSVAYQLSLTLFRCNKRLSSTTRRHGRTVSSFWSAPVFPAAQHRRSH